MHDAPGTHPIARAGRLDLDDLDEKIAAIPSWPVSDQFDEIERAVLAFADAIVYDRGRVADEVFAVLQKHLSDEAVLELTYVTAMYDMHATITRALKLEWEDIPEHVCEVDPPEGFDAQKYMEVGSEADAKERLRNARR